MNGHRTGRRSWRTPFAPGLSFPSVDTPYFRAYAQSPDPCEQIRIAAELGFSAVFDSYLMTRSPDEQAAIGDAIESAGVEMEGAIFAPETMGKPMWSASDADGIRKLEHTIREAIVSAKRGRARQLTVLTARRRFIPIGQQLFQFAENLKRFTPLLGEEGIDLCVEAACPELAPSTLVQRLLDAYTVVRVVDSPSVSIMFDSYHIAMTEGDVSGNLKWVADKTKSIQISDTARNEPGSGAFNFANIITTALRAGYSGCFELEHLFAAPGVAGLDAALRRLAAIDDAVIESLERGSSEVRRSDMPAHHGSSFGGTA